MTVGFFRTASSICFSSSRSTALAAVRLLAANVMASCSQSIWFRSRSACSSPAARMMYSRVPTDRSSSSDTPSITSEMSGCSPSDAILLATLRMIDTRFVARIAAGSGISDLYALRTRLASCTQPLRVASSISSASTVESSRLTNSNPVAASRSVSSMSLAAR